MISKAEYAEWLGISEDEITDAKFNKLMSLGILKLEQALGYQLCPLKGLGITFCPLVETPPETPEQIALLPTITIPFRPWQKHISLPPFLKLYSVEYTSCEGVEFELEDCDYRITQKSQYVNASWNNTIEICSNLGCKGIGMGFRCSGRCLNIVVRAYWGLCCGELPDESGESGEDVYERECCLPEDLTIILLDLMAENDDCDKSNIKKESSLSYSYEKFEKQDVLVSYSVTINKYAITTPEEYPL